MNIPEDIRQAILICCSWAELYGHKVEEDAAYAVMEWLDAQPAAPEPDWTTAPDWAQWWAVDEDGRTYWYNRQPYVKRAEDGCWDGNGEFEWNGDVDLPVGMDWRTTLRHRPEEVQP